MYSARKRESAGWSDSTWGRYISTLGVRWWKKTRSLFFFTILSMKTRRNSREISSPQKEGLLTFDQDWFALVPQGSHWVLPTVEMFHSTVGARFAGGNSGGSSSAFWFAPTAPTLCAELAYVCELSRKLPTGKEVERRNFSFFVIFFFVFCSSPCLCTCSVNSNFGSRRSYPEEPPIELLCIL